VRRPERVELDPIDHSILNILELDARASYTSIGQRVGLSTPSVIERVRKLEERGVIRGYRAEIDYCKAGFPIHAFIWIKQDKYYYGIPKQINDMEKVYSFWMVSGYYDYLLEVFLQDSNELNDLLEDLYRIGRTYTMLILNKLKNDSIVGGDVFAGRPFLPKEAEECP
jgi:Lrp/AsnC family leucine-responsive transcriptional regulator